MTKFSKNIGNAAAALVAAFLMPLPSTAFEIEPPVDIARMAMPCWKSAKVAEALTLAEFDPVSRGLLIEKTDPTQPLVTFWAHLLTGKGVITLSHPTGEECRIAGLEDAR